MPEGRNKYFINHKCVKCKICYTVCALKCIDITKQPFVINQQECVGCGNCVKVCPMESIVEYPGL